MGCACACTGGACTGGESSSSSSSKQQKSLILRSIFDEQSMYDLASGRELAAYSHSR